MDIRQIAEEMGKLNAYNQSSEDAIADYLLVGLRMRSDSRNAQKAFLAVSIQAYALLLQEAGVKVEA